MDGSLDASSTLVEQELEEIELLADVRLKQLGKKDLR